MNGSTFVLLALLAVPASAAEPGLKKGDGVLITLTDGREVRGIFIESKPDVIWVGVDQGEIGLDPQTVAAMKAESNPQSEYEKRLGKLARSDAAGRWELTLWAKESGLTATAEEGAEGVIAADPGHRGARELLGHELHDGKWMTRAEAMRAKGFIEYKGEWVTKDQYTSLEGIRLREDSQTQRTRESLASQRQRYHAIDAASAGQSQHSTISQIRVEYQYRPRQRYRSRSLRGPPGTRRW